LDRAKKEATYDRLSLFFDMSHQGVAGGQTVETPPALQLII
jgi:hypothetical protein